MKYFSMNLLSKYRKYKTIIFIGAFFAVPMSLVVGGLVLSSNAWGDYKKKYNQNITSTIADINNAVISKIDSDINSTDKLETIIQLQSKIEKEIVDYCSVNSLIKWQSIIVNHANDVENCERRKMLLEKFVIELNLYTRYLKAEYDLAVIIETANTKTNQNNNPEGWELIEGFWRNAGSEASKLPDYNQFKDVKNSAIECINGIADNWKDISDANKSNDRVKFGQSKSSLTEKYALFTVIVEKSSAEIEKLSKSLDDSYKVVY